MICGHARIQGIPVGVIANARGMLKDPHGGAPKFGGIIYADSADKVAFFIETLSRHGTPILFVQDVSGFMVGSQAEHSGIIRAGARFVEAMATAGVPKIVLTINHASGAGYYAMAGQGFDPDFIFTWPTGRMGVMEGDSAVMALFSGQLEALKKEGKQPDDGAAGEDGLRPRRLRPPAGRQVRRRARLRGRRDPAGRDARRAVAGAAHVAQQPRPAPGRLRPAAERVAAPSVA